jgi:hypothetical protein
MMHVKVESVFRFEKYFLKNVVNMGNKLANHIKVGRECVNVELGKILPVCNIHFVLRCNVMWLIIFMQISFQIKRGFIYYFIHCSCKYMKHVNFNQLTWTPFMFEKNGQIMNTTKLTYMINVTTHTPARTTGSHHMHLTLQNAVNCGRS